MSKKFFNKSDLFYNLSTESIKIQPNDYSVQAITAEFQKIIDVLENDTTANSLVAIKKKDIAQAFVNIDNILTKRFGMKYMDAQRHIYAHVNTVSPIISEALDIITAESPGGRIHLCIQRNQK